jgi:hypothetical protein
MTWVFSWLAGAVVVYFLNGYWLNSLDPPKVLGLAFTDKLLGFPLRGEWFCLSISAYCLARYFYRKRRKEKAEGKKSG